jgi:hypothetical protein
MGIREDMLVLASREGISAGGTFPCHHVSEQRRVS